MFASGIHSAVERIKDLEATRARVDAEAADLLSEIEKSGVYTVDCHSSAKTMRRHVGCTSDAEAARLEAVSRAMRTLPAVADAYRVGELTVDQMSLLGRVHRNQRVRAAMVDAQEWFLEMAAANDYRGFEEAIRTWERLADEDGPEPNERMQRARRFAVAQDPLTLTWSVDGRLASFAGAQVHEIWQHYLAAELAADWEKARAEHGEDACDLHLPRTTDQRAADAFWQIFQDAAASPKTATPPDVCHNIVWNAEAYEAMLRRFDGEAPSPLDPDTYRCETINGIPVEPYEAAAMSLVQQVRRVLVDASSTVIDLGRARTFTGSSRTAAKLQSSSCFWPGCHVPADRCQIDHTRGHARGGRTNPGNGAPACGRHNRAKENGFTVWRDPSGQWHTYRPDGTEIE